MNKIFIENIAHGGYGIGRIDGKIVFVEGALPKEELYINIFDNRKDYSVAKIVDILRASKYRIKPKCPYYGECGGCDFQHMEYDYQIELKKRIFVSTFNRIGNIDIKTGDIQTETSDCIFNYRRRVRFRCKGAWWGFLRKRSRDIVTVESCFIADKKINEYVRSGSCVDKEIVLSDDGLINKKNAFLDLTDVAKGLYLYYKYGSFVQVNRNINIKMIKVMSEEIRDKKIESVFDFFCGIGNFSLPLAVLGVNVAGFDSNKQAIDSFNGNAERLKVSKTAKAFVRNLNKPFLHPYKLHMPQCVILDPPRAGAKYVVKYLVEKRPQYVFYISCEPSTLARDLRILSNYYTMEKIVLFDMFPQTHHFESFVVLRLK